MNGPGPIPWSSIEKWATRHGIDDVNDLGVLVEHIRAMELALDEFNAKRKKLEGRTDDRRTSSSRN